MFPGDYKVNSSKYLERIKKTHHINKDPQDKKPIKYRKDVKEELAVDKKTLPTKENKNKSSNGLNLYF